MGGGWRAECCCYNSTASICSYGLVQYISQRVFAVALLDSPLQASNQMKLISLTCCLLSNEYLCDGRKLLALSRHFPSIVTYGALITQTIPLEEARVKCCPQKPH